MDKETKTKWNPHAFHRNLPPHHMDDDGVPYITKFAENKARKIVELANSLELNESLFCRDEEIEEEDDDDEEDDHALPKDYTLATISRKCARLQTQLSTLEGLKHRGISQEELCDIVLRVLRLVTATVTFEYTLGETPIRRATLHYENVGYLFQDTKQVYEMPKTTKQLDEELEQRFALPEPAREALLSVVITILSKKGPLRSVSNASLSSEKTRLILHWRVLLRMLLRTSPYLDEHKTGHPPTCSNSRTNTIVRRTVHLIRHARHFFDQTSDATSKDIWNMVREDVLHHTHTHACYRGAIMLYLFLPSQCSSEFYLGVLPLWLQSWSSIDRCPDFDYMWLVLFCRARKHVSPFEYDWGPMRKRLLTHSQYWLQIPIGGSSDKSFPRAASPRSRSCPARLKAFVGSASSYEEGMDFVAKVVKLLVVSIGTNSLDENSESDMSQGSCDVLRFLAFVAPYYNPSNIGSWTFTLGAFLHYFCYEFSRRVATAASFESLKSSNRALASVLIVAEPGMNHVSILPHELVAFLNALLPLCQQALYSKNGYVGRAGEAAMTYLAQIDPIHVTPPFLDFATNALDVSAVNLAHQAPSALSALARLVQPSLRRKPSILLRRLPQILQLSLAGIDSNDQNKCIRTLIFYRSLTSWVPIVADAKNWPVTTSIDASEGRDGTITVGKNNMKYLEAVTSSVEYLEALERLPETSLLRQYDALQDDEPGISELLLDEAAAAMGDWVLAFLDRIYDLLRATGEREKTGKTGSGVATRHSSSDVQQSRNFSRVMKECLMQIFAVMDERTHKMAVRSVLQFLTEETLPSAAKDAAALCQAAAAAPDDGDNSHSSPGLSALVPVLLENLSGHSNKTVIYRLRCLAGAVRSAGHGLINHRAELSRAINFALSSNDKDVFKTGCKLLRHTLSSLCEAYPISTESMPMRELDENSEGGYALGKSGSLKGSCIRWYVPIKEEVEFACVLLQDYAIQRINSVCLAYANEGFLSQQGSEDEDAIMVDADDSDQEPSKPVSIMLLRRCLRVLRYSLRGCAGLLMDKTSSDPSFSDTDVNPVPHEQAVLRLLASASGDAAESLTKMRGLLCSFLVSLTSGIASETADSPADMTSKTGDTSTGGQRQNVYSVLISSDAKVCKELSDITTMLLTRRSAPFRSQEWSTIWKAQKQNETDVLIANFADYKASVLQRASQYGDNINVLYKDGEDGGKTLPRRLLVARLQIFYESIQRNASFEIPRRLRRVEGRTSRSSDKLFATDLNLETSLAQLVKMAKTSTPPALSCYESLVDGLFALCCHPNTQVRGSAIGVIDYAFTRFGWLVRSRVPRLLAAISLEDEDMKGKYGIPSCSQLSIQVDSQGKRKRLAEVLKGVCSILAAPRAIGDLMWSEKIRSAYVKTLCGTDKLMSTLPVEEMSKMVHYFQQIFSPFRSKFFSLPRATAMDQLVHEDCLRYLLDILSDEGEDAAIKQGAGDDAELLKVSGESHWRKRLLVGWFVSNFIDEDDMIMANPEIRYRLWKVCFDLLDKEMGQPLQRVAVGLFGRLVSYISFSRVTDSGPDTGQVELTRLRETLEKESFCRILGQALVYDHKPDTSIGGGHDAQWSAGVEDILRDSSRFVAPKSMFPFKRTSQNSGLFKMQHAQLIESVLRAAGNPYAQEGANHLLAFAKEMAAAPPSEDQRNQQCTSAEVFGGVCRALLDLASAQDQASVWQSTLLPFLEEVIPKIPISLASAFFDAFRYGFQSSHSSTISPLVAWIVGRIDSSLWRPTEKALLDTLERVENVTADDIASGADGFASQSKWLYLACAIVIEMGEENELVLNPPWFTEYLQDGATDLELRSASQNGEEPWNVIRDELLPRLVASVGHPYETCRDHIAGCLFRIWRCNDRFALSELSNGNDPTSLIIEKLTSLDTASDLSFKERYNSLITARKFVSYCTHLGDAQNEFSRLVIPLLPVAFEALKATVDEGSSQAEDDNASKRALEAEVVKGFRYTIAEVGSSCVMAYPDQESDISRVLQTVEKASKHEFWQVRQAAAHFLRCFQNSHKFLFSSEHSEAITRIVSSLLSDERREVSSASMAALTGILAATPLDTVSALVMKYAAIANRSRQKKKNGISAGAFTDEEAQARDAKDKKRGRNQQTSVFFLCAAVLAQPYETPPYVPVALASISKHSFERSAPLGVRDTVKKCCSEFKRTHMSDNWEIHRKVFTQEQLEALDDVVSSPHYYA